MELQTDDARMNRDELKTIEIRALNGSRYDGVQFTLQWDVNQLEVVSVEPNAKLNVRDDHYSLLHQPSGRMTFSWNGLLSDGDVLFTLQVRSKSNVRLSESLVVNSAITPAVSVVKDDVEEGQVVLGFRGMAAEEFVVLQNEPNPWNRETVIGMLMPESGPVTISVYDLTGKVHMTETLQLPKGYNEYTIDRNRINQAGVYYYQIDYQTQTQTRKMVIME